MKRYILFGYDNYYPTGGFNDVIGSYDTKEEYRDKMEESKYENYQVFDCDLKHLIYDSWDEKMNQQYLKDK